MKQHALKYINHPFFLRQASQFFANKDEMGARVACVA